jgi:hypothetical protein
MGQRWTSPEATEAAWKPNIAHRSIQVSFPVDWYGQTLTLTGSSTLRTCEMTFTVQSWRTLPAPEPWQSDWEISYTAGPRREESSS